ncbi:MAG: hypothetical protein IT384_00530 [Deltaproteobacteria bacterium]|nr:hypothetical protein [Deltaproteobacteria bacterium]
MKSFLAALLITLAAAQAACGPDRECNKDSDCRSLCDEEPCDGFRVFVCVEETVVKSSCYCACY